MLEDGWLGHRLWPWLVNDVFLTARIFTYFS
jgi:hypothetical protein